MTWKPTDEMRAIIQSMEHTTFCCNECRMKAAIAHVQPLIAAEAMECAAQIADGFAAAAKAEPKEPGDFEVFAAAESIAEAIRFASGKAFVGIAAEARAKALEEFGELIEARRSYRALMGNTVEAEECRFLLIELRSLIPKPPEGT